MTRIDARPLVLGAIAALMLSTGLPALAQPAGSVTEFRINTADIDLSSPAGVRMLQDRVDAAVRSACAPVEFGAPIAYAMRDQASAEADCVSGARALAAPQAKKLVADGSIKVAAY